MGGITQFPSRETMKLSLALVAAANANQMDWMVNQWWEEAVQVFDFSNKNWAAFAGAVNAVDESQYKPLWNYCNPDGDAALTTAELTDCGQSTGRWSTKTRTALSTMTSSASRSPVSPPLTPESSLPLSIPTETASSSRAS